LEKNCDIIDERQGYDWRARVLLTAVYISCGTLGQRTLKKKIYSVAITSMTLLSLELCSFPREPPEASKFDKFGCPAVHRMAFLQFVSLCYIHINGSSTVGRIMFNMLMIMMRQVRSMDDAVPNCYGLAQPELLQVAL